jgi:hypothetical protein
MALIYCDKFSKYANITDFRNDNPQYWSSTATNPTFPAGSGRFGDAGLRNISRTLGLTFLWDSFASGTTQIIEGAFRFNMTQQSNGITGAPQTWIDCTTSSLTTIHWRLSIRYGGQILLYRNGAVFQTMTAPGVIQNNVWHHIQIKASALDSGSMIIRVDGVEVMNVTGVDLRTGTSPSNGAIQRLTIYSASSTNGGETQDVDYLILMDGSGSSFNDFVGDMRIEWQLPDAVGATNQWTQNTGPSTFEAIDDGLAAYDDDTTYITEGTVGERSLFSHGTVAATGANPVRFVSHQALTRNDGSNNVALVCVSGATTSVGATVTLSTAYRWVQRNLETDPNTAAAWSLANINAAEFGVDCTA